MRCHPTCLARQEIIKRATGERLGHVTVSVGVAELRDDDTPGSLIERADGALYEAKRAGRNRVESGAEIPDDQPKADERAA